MKRFAFLLGAGVGALSLMAGCASKPVALASVGPNPVLRQSGAPAGQLQVFSRMRDASDDENQGGEGIPTWRQHTDYSIYNLQGLPVKHVENVTAHYAKAPAQVTLPAGKYMVVAQARDYFWVKVPVTIEPGLITRVHLDDKWKPPGEMPRNEVATMPDGKPIGWRAR